MPTTDPTSTLDQVETGIEADLVFHESVATLRAAVLILGRRMRHQVVGEELTPSEMAVLGRLLRGATTPGCLARSEHVQPPSMTRLLERLESKGLVVRSPDPHDRRQVLIDLTPAARDHIERTRQARSAWLAGQLTRLDPADLEAVLAVAPALLRLAETS